MTSGQSGKPERGKLRAPESADPSPVCRERDELPTRRAIAHAALRLFAERGFEATTIEDITAVLGVSPRTFFAYFGSKEEVVLCEGEVLGRLRQALAERPYGEPAGAAVREAILTFADGLTEDELEIVLLGSRLVAWEELIGEALAARLEVDREGDLRCPLVAAAVVAALRASLAVWVAGDRTRDFRSIAAEALSMLEQGIGDDP